MNAIKPEIIEEQEIPMFSLKEELAKIKKRDGELGFRANKAEEYLGNFVFLKPKEAKELVEKLKKLQIPRLKNQHIFKIVDLLPETPEELKFILQSFTITINSENAKKITELVKSFKK